jgi:hypothetical protein
MHSHMPLRYMLGFSVWRLRRCATGFSAST